uniref:Uncharacterized protein n=1 Tax=Siphoviridae sp. ct0Wl9 TaxID=2827763 RepID=A0A8S5T8L6_9CAUD|nr:MAG TPA: hypothetical protein [Siphoviridae sp. ct0Wl9]
MSKSRIGRVMNEEWRNNLSKSHKGKKKGKYNYSLSSEQKEHLSNKLKQYYQDNPEYKLNKKFSSKKIVKIECDGIIFDTIYDGAKYYGVDKSSMSSWLSGKYCVPQEFINKKLHKIGQDIEYEKVLLKNKNKIYCDKIEYDSIKDCAKFYKIDPIIMKKWLNNPNKMPKKFKDLNLHKEPAYGYKLKK